MSQTAQNTPMQVVENTSVTNAVNATPHLPPSGEALASKPEVATPDPRLEALARKERALSKQMRAFREERKAFEAEKSSRLDSQSWKQKFMEDPGAVGLTYEEIQNRYLTQPSPEQQREADLKREIEAVKKSQEELAQRTADSQKQAYDQALKQISREVSSLVEANKDFELVKAYEASDQVVSLIEETYKEEGVLLTTEEALREVEGYLMEQAQKILTLEKLKAKIQPPAETSAPQAEEKVGMSPRSSASSNKITITSSQTRPTTLTHAMSQASTRPAGTMTSRERAIAAFKGQLNK